MSSSEFQGIIAECLSDIITPEFANDIRQSSKWAKSFTTPEELEKAQKIISEIKECVSQLNELSRPVITMALKEVQTASNSVVDIAVMSMISLLMTNKSNSAVLNLFGQFSSRMSMRAPNPQLEQQLDIELEEELSDIPEELVESINSLSLPD